MDELDVVGALRPAVTIPEEARVAARSKLDRVSVEATDERRSIGRRVGALAAVAAVAALVLVAGTLWPSSTQDGNPADSAYALVFADGSKLTAREVTRAIAGGETDELQRRLAEYGVTLRIDEKTVHPDADGRFYGWSFHPSGTSQPGENGTGWYIDEDDAGSTLVVSIGRGEEASTRGLSMWEVFPELCDAIEPEDLASTQANLEALGFTAKWSLLNGHPDDPSYTGEGGTLQTETPEDGAIYAVLAGKPFGAAYDVSPDMDSVLLEVVPDRGGRESRVWRGMGCR